ncbi:MAG: cardiolipin synthase, partial [Planctomycetes bacterium]|nr:cardiolipin synthase [Planctomycetota bacterium]
WIFAIIFLPYVGALVCGLFGTTRWERRTGRKRAAAAQIDQSIPAGTEELETGGDELHRWAPVARLVADLTGAPALSGNQVELSADTRRSLEMVEETIDAAQRWIHIEFYIWRSDKVGRHIRDRLIEKARAGVQVRFLYDGVGSMQLSRQFLKPLRAAGVHVAPFTPGLQVWHMLTLNLRNHRKIVVTDQQTAFTGGMNIGDEYVHPTKSYGQWRDTQLRLRGPAASQLQRVFAQDWLFATGEELTASEYYPAPQRCGPAAAQVVADGPDNAVDTFYMAAVAVLGLARERVTLTTPYFVPPEGLEVALAAAARRGVRVRLMIACRGNFIWTLHAGRSYYESLLDAGVEIYEYEKGLFHAKTFSVDGEWSLVGTPNWDFRSLILNFETAVAFFDRQLAEELESHFEQDREFARRIDQDQWRRRSRLTVLHEQFWRIFAPVL